MKRAILRRSLTLGALMALVITGNAMATEWITGNQNEYIVAEQNANDVKVVIDNNNFEDDVKNWTVSAGGNNKLIFQQFDFYGNNTQNTLSINGNNIDFNPVKSYVGTVNIKADGILNFSGTSNYSAIRAGNTSGTSTGILNIEAGTINITNNSGTAVSTNSTSQMTLKADLINIKAGNVRSVKAIEGNVDVFANAVDISVDNSSVADTGNSHVIFGNINFGGKDSTESNLTKAETITITTKNVANAVISSGNDIVFNTKKLTIDSDTNALQAIQNEGSIEIVADEVDVTGNVYAIKGGNVNIGTEDSAVENIKINGNIWTQKYNDEADSVKTETQINIHSKGNLIIEGDIDTTGREGGIININQGANDSGNVQITGNILTGDITDDEYENAGQINVNLNGINSFLNGNIVDNNFNNGSGAGGTSISFSDGATWNVTGDSTVKEVNVNNAQINLNAGQEQKVNIATLNGIDSNINVNDLTKDKITIGTNNSTGLQLTGTSMATDNFDGNNLLGSMQQLADTVEITSGSQLDNVVAEEGKIFGQITAKVDANGNIIAGSVIEDGNIANEGITELANVAFMAWRAENDEMHQRMGELRSSKGEAGIWARMKRGESKYGDMDIKNQYSTYQLGYDEKVGDSNWYIGGAISRTEGKSSFATGSGENQSTGFTMYGTYVADDGQYLDLSAKYARLDNEFDVFGRSGMESTGDYRNNGYAFSAEYGKRIEAGSDFWIEPQVQLTYGHLSSANYTTSRGVRVTQDAMDSVVGRLGFAAGKDIGAGNVYVKASYLYDFDGDTNVRMTDGKNSAVYDQDLGGGWFEVGIGTNINLSETSHLYFDVEKTYGGDITTPWQWNAGVRFDF